MQHNIPDFDVSRKLIDLNILFLLSFGPKTGYGLQREIWNMFGFKVSFGTLYPHLHRLESLELIEGFWEEQDTYSRKRRYVLTSEGVSVFQKSRETLSKITQTMKL